MRTKHPLITITKEEWECINNQEKPISPETIFITVAGSTLTNVQDEYSDIDLCVWNIKEPATESEKHIDFKQTYIHWYYNILPCNCPVKLPSGGDAKEARFSHFNKIVHLETYFLKKEHFLYIKPGWEKIADLFLQRITPLLGECGIYDTLIPIKADNIEKDLCFFIFDGCGSKAFLDYGLVYYILTKEPIDYNFLKVLHRSSQTPLSQENREKFAAQVQYIYNYYNLKENYDVSHLIEKRQQVYKQIEKEWNKILLEIKKDSI